MGTPSGPPPNLEGRVLGGRYRVFRAIGEGGMGAVYAALQLDLQRRVAIKILHGAERLSQESVRRFRQEALAAAELGHPNIVQVTDFQANAGEPPFLVMEMLEGESLQTLLQREPILAPERAAFIAAQVLAALAAAHAARIVHRDIKPGNVFLSRTPAMGDLVKVLDFGIAKVLRDVDEAPRSVAGSVVGTPAYMAPEQARGSEVDARADLYSVGACLFEMLVGRRPFGDGDTGDALATSTNAAPRVGSLAPGVDARLAAAVDRALAKDPAARPQSALEMLRGVSPSVRAPSSGDVSAGHAMRSEEPRTERTPPMERMHSHASRPVNVPQPTPSARARGVIAGILAFAGLSLVVGVVVGVAWLRQRTKAIPSPPLSPSVTASPLALPNGPIRLWYPWVEPIFGALVGDAAEDFAGAFSESGGPKGIKSALYFGVIDGATMKPSWQSTPFDPGARVHVGVVGQRVFATTGVHEVTAYAGATGQIAYAVDTTLPVVQLCRPVGSTKELWLELEKNHESTLDVETGILRPSATAPPGCRYLDLFGKGRGKSPLGEPHAARESRRVGNARLDLLVDGDVAVHSGKADNRDELLEAFDTSSWRSLWSRRDDPIMRYPHLVDVIGGRAFVQDNSSLECVDARSGASVWKAPVNTSTLTRLNASAERVYVVQAGGIVVLDAKTGQGKGTFGYIMF
jgi:serine/threonine protein kinase